MLGLSMTHNSIPPAGYELGKEQGCRETIFFCRHRQMEVLAECKPAERKMAVGGALLYELFAGILKDTYKRAGIDA